MLLQGFHYPFPSLAYVEKSGDGYREVMTTEVVCCGPEADLDDVSALMQKRRIRHVPVCTSGGKLLWMVSIGDVNAAHASNQETTIHFLNEYIYGRV